MMNDGTLPTSCESCQFTKVKEHKIFNHTALTPVCDHDTEKEYRITPHHWSVESGLEYSPYRPTWCPFVSDESKEKS